MDIQSLEKTASFSRCGQYRYSLSREFDSGTGRCVFIGLNPSTAVASLDDPTIRRCMGFAMKWGYRQMHMVNLFAYRTPHPRILKLADEPEGAGNRRAIKRLCKSADCIVAAWGAHGTYRDQAQKLERLWSDFPLHSVLV